MWPHVAPSLHNTIIYRILNRMKVTTLIPDQLVHEVAGLARGKTLTESLVIVLKEWLAWKKIKALNQQIAAKPLLFTDGFSATKVRELSRQARNRK